MIRVGREGSNIFLKLTKYRNKVKKNDRTLKNNTKGKRRSSIYN